MVWCTEGKQYRYTHTHRIHLGMKPLKQDRIGTTFSSSCICFFSTRNTSLDFKKSPWCCRKHKIPWLKIGMQQVRDVCNKYQAIYIPIHDTASVLLTLILWTTNNDIISRMEWCALCSIGALGIAKTSSACNCPIIWVLTWATIVIVSRVSTGGQRSAPECPTEQWLIGSLTSSIPWSWPLPYKSPSLNNQYNW